MAQGRVMAGWPVAPPHRSASITPMFIRLNVHPLLSVSLKIIAQVCQFLLPPCLYKTASSAQVLKSRGFLGCLAPFLSLSILLAMLCKILIRKDKYSCNWIYPNETQNSCILPGQSRESILV